MKQLRQVARDKGVELRLLRQGRHEVWFFGTERLVILRHKEIDEHTARAILGQARKSTGRSLR